MLNEPTMEKLYAMRLAAMAAAWQQQHVDTNVAELGFDDRFTLLVEAEHLARDNRKLDRLLNKLSCASPMRASKTSTPVVHAGSTSRLCGNSRRARGCGSI